MNTFWKIIIVGLIALVFFMMGRVYILSKQIKNNEETIFKLKEQVEANEDGFSEDIAELYNYHLK